MATDGVTLTSLAELPPGTMLDETALASALNVSTRTVRRMVDRCEIPAGVKLGARKMWFSERVLAYLRERADRETVEARKAAARFDNKF
jgi:predicted DNA-binding transcriptional regulator AlpA